MRTRLSCAFILLFVVTLTVSVLAQEVPLTEDTFDLKLLADGLTSPVYLCQAPDNSGRLFVVDQIGVIWVIDSTGHQQATPFLDLRDKVIALNPAYDERGLLGLAFHPNFHSNGRFFVYYSKPLRPEAPQDYDHTNVVAEYYAGPDSATADPNSEKILLQDDHPQFNHNAGTLAFGPDGYLYISIGDGGGANDTGLGHVKDWYTENAGGNGQDVTHNLRGNVLRIDIDNIPAGQPYGIPSDNPFYDANFDSISGGDTLVVDSNGMDEIYAYGFRNPYRFSFDMGGNHLIYLGDAGQNRYEEADIVVKGGNYGWNVKEGSECFDADNALNEVDSCPDVDSMGNPLRDPFVEFTNSAYNEPGEEAPQLGLVIVGGFIYRGNLLNGHDGHYFFGTPTDTFGVPRGKVFMAEGTPDTMPLAPKWSIEQLVFKGHSDATVGSYVLGFGQDKMGELYVLVNDVLGPTGNTGKVYMLTPSVTDTIPDTTGIDSLVTPTDQWINVYCGNPMLDSVPLNPGDTIAVYDNDDVLSGIGLVRANGAFGFIPVYRDDTTSHGIDEGADPGDTLMFEINGVPVTPETPVTWTELGDRIEICNFTSGREEGGCLSIPLHNGWNYVSWNVAYSDSIQKAFADIMDCIGVVQAFDSSGLTFDPKKPEFSTLWTVDYFHGYEIRIVGNECHNDSLEICGDPIENSGIRIHQGWNFVSYWPQDPMPPESALSSIMDNLLVTYTFDKGVKMFRPTLPDFNTLDMMEEGYGYWINSSENDLLVYPGFGTSGAPSGLAFLNAGPTAVSRSWISIYGKNITLNGQPIPSGATIAAYTMDGVLSGTGIYRDGILKFTPVYGRDNSSEAAKALAGSGDGIYLTVSGTRVWPELTWQEDGALVPIGQLSTSKIDATVPGSFSLTQNYPNPFNPSTQISFSVPIKSLVTLEIYNFVGQHVRTLVTGSLEAGLHSVVWDGRADDGTDVASGLYLYRLQAANFNETKKMLLMK